MIIILEDSRNQEGKHELKHDYWRSIGVEWRRTKLYTGDYTLPLNQSVCVDTKSSIQELIGDVCSKDHKRFRAECIRAQEAGIRLIVLLETNEIKTWHDLICWHNPRKATHPKATNGAQLFKALVAMNQRYGVEWRICRKEDAGRAVLKLLGVET